MILIIFIVLINIPLAWSGHIEYLMFLCGVSLMINILKQIKDIFG